MHHVRDPEVVILRCGRYVKLASKLAQLLEAKDTSHTSDLFQENRKKDP